MRDLADRSARDWSAAETFAELLALGERFVAGEIDRFPGWGASALDAESSPLRARLVAFHRGGLLTVASQPGVRGERDHDGKIRAQRAFVCGFASRPAARALERLRDESGLCVGVFAHGADRGSELAVGTRGGVPYAFAGYNAFDDELECFSELCSPRALSALREQLYVSIVDLDWGRRDRLFALVGRALRAA